MRGTLVRTDKTAHGRIMVRFGVSTRAAAHSVFVAAHGDASNSQDFFLALEVLAQVLRARQHMRWWHAHHLHDADQEVVLRCAREQWQTQVELSRHAPQRPHVDGHIIWVPQQHLAHQTKLSAS